MTAKDTKEVFKPDVYVTAKPDVAKTEPDAAKTAPDAAKTEPEVQNFKFVKTVYGDMHDPHTGTNYGFAPKELLKASSWVDSQIAAGKMVYAE